MAGRVAWDVEHREAGDLVALAELTVDGMAGPDEDAEVEAGHRMTRLALADQVGVLGRVRIALAYPEGDAEVLAQLMARTLMGGVRVGQGVRVDPVALELLQDLGRRVPGPGIDQDVVDQIGVDRVREKEGVEMPDAVGDLLHGGGAYPSRTGARDTMGHSDDRVRRRLR